MPSTLQSRGPGATTGALGHADRPTREPTIDGPGSPSSSSPQRAWEALAHLIAGRGEYRWCNADGKYLPRNARPITSTLPARPAAVMIYDVHGHCKTLCLDFDAGKVGPQRLAGDLLRVRTALTNAGIEFVEDASVSGGHHIYVPLGMWWHQRQARSFVEHLAASLPSLDPSPHRSSESGCIRVPGSAHKAGGFQRLLTPLADAERILSSASSADRLKDVLEVFARPVLLPSELLGPSPRVGPSTPSAGRPSSSPRSKRVMRSDLTELAESGVVPTRYASASEARMAVLCSLASAGWNAENVWTQARGGRFQGLGSLYAKYSPSQQQATFTREWSKAQLFTNEFQRKHAGQVHGAKSDMNQALTSQGGSWDEHGFLRKFRSVLDLYDLRLRDAVPARQVPGAALLLRAMLMFAHMTGKRELAIGCRNLAVATGQSYQTVAKLLRVLSTMPEAPIALKHRGVGLEADTYVITLDTSLEPVAERRGLARGRIHALRPVFRVLGAICALIYEGIERLDTPSINELTYLTGFHRSTVRDALYELLCHGMIKRHITGWRIDHTANLGTIARDLGALEDFEAQVYRYRAERRIWREIVAQHHVLSNDQRHISEIDIHDPESDTFWIRPADAAHNTPELLINYVYPHPSPRQHAELRELASA